MKKYRSYFLLAGGVIFVLIPLYLFTNFFDRADSSIVKIGEIPVSEEEFRLHLNRNIAGTYNYYYQEWGVNASEEFWDSQYGDKTPLEYIKDRTMQQLIGMKSKQQLAIDMGLVKAHTYDSLVNWWVVDNIERQTKKDSGGVVYGPVQREFGDYYDYFYSNLFMKLNDEVNKTLLNASQVQLKIYYEQHKSKWFSYIPEAEVEYLEFRYVGSSQKKQYTKLAEAAITKILDGNNIRKVEEEYPECQYGRQVFENIDEVLGEEDRDGQLKSWAFRVKPDETKVLHGGSTVYVIHCIRQAPKKAYSFDEIEKDVVWYYQKNHYEEMLDSIRENTEIHINYDRFDHLTIQP